MNLMNLYTGLKMYKFPNGSDKPDIIRIIDNDYSNKKVSYLDSENRIRKMSTKEARSYKTLAPDGLVIIANVTVASDTTTDNDVVVLLIYGISISTETCPANMDYNWFFAYKDIGYKKSIAVYLDDTLESILSLIDSRKFDTVLDELHKKYSSYYEGFCKTLKELIDKNSFMVDFRKCFNIIEVPFHIDDSVDFLSNENMAYLSTVTGDNIVETYVMRYSKEINTHEFSREYVLVTSAFDKYDKVFIVGYDKI